MPCLFLFCIELCFPENNKGGFMSEISNKMEIIEGICGICPGNCAVEIHKIDGKIDKVLKSEKNKYGLICLRASKAKEIVYSEDRITTPLIRTGKKGTKDFREATWEEALSYASEGFLKIKEKYGAQSLASHYGRGAFDQPFEDFFSGTGDNKYGGIFGYLGSPNTGSVGSLCYVSYGVFAPIPTMGIPSSFINADIENADTIFVWGTNPPTASPPLKYHRIKEAKKRGAKVITVDHYKSIMADNSNEVVLVNSGTDGFLILGLINYLIENNKYNKEFVEEYTYGFEELKKYVKDFTLDKVLDVCGIKEEDFYLIARELSKEKVTLLTYTGLEYSNCGVQTIRAIYSLWAMTGHLDEKGGLILDKAKKEEYSLKKERSLEENLPVGYKNYPLFCDLTGNMQFNSFPKAVLEEKPYKIAGLFNVGSVISINYPSSQLYEEALKSLEMFVTVDRFMSKDTLYADVVLPATTYFEDESYACYPDMVRKRERIIEPIGQAKSHIEIIHALAEKLGYGDNYPKNSEELLQAKFGSDPELLKAILENPQGVSLDKGERTYYKYKTGGLRNDKKAGFPTQSGKFEFKSSMLESYGFDGLPKFEFSKEGRINNPDLAEKYPLILNSGARIQSTFRTQHLNIPELVKFQESPYIIMNTEDAKEREISTGDEVIVSTLRGEIKVIANVIEGINKGDTEINVGGGQDFQLGLWKDANTNYLTDIENVDPISGFPVLKNLLCEVRKG